MEPILGGDGGADGLLRWAADARADDAAAARSRERWLRQQADEEATFAGVLLDLAERREPVVVHTTGGRRHHGVLGAVGLDHCTVVASGGRCVLLARDAIASVRAAAGATAPGGDRVVTATTRLVDALTALAGNRPRVQIAVRGEHDAMSGRLVAVGQDVVTLQLDGDRGAVAYVAIDAIAEVAER